MANNKVFLIGTPEQLHLFFSYAYQEILDHNLANYFNYKRGLHKPVYAALVQSKFFQTVITKNWHEINFLCYSLDTSPIISAQLVYERMQYFLRDRNFDDAQQGYLLCNESATTTTTLLKLSDEFPQLNLKLEEIRISEKDAFEKIQELARRIDAFIPKMTLEQQESVVRSNLQFQALETLKKLQEQYTAEIPVVKKGHDFSLQWKKPVYDTQKLQATLNHQLNSDDSCAALFLKTRPTVTSQTTAIQYLNLLQDFAAGKISLQTTSDFYGITMNEELAHSLRISQDENRKTFMSIKTVVPNISFCDALAFDLRTRHRLPQLPKIDNADNFYASTTRDHTCKLENLYDIAQRGSTESHMPLDATLPTLVETKNGANELLKDIVDFIIDNLDKYPLVKSMQTPLPIFHILEPPTTSPNSLLILQHPSKAAGFVDFFNFGKILTDCNFKLFGATYKNHYSDSPERAEKVLRAMRSLCLIDELKPTPHWDHVVQLGRHMNLTTAESFALYLYTNNINQTEYRDARKLYSEINATFRGDFKTLLAHHELSGIAKQLSKILLVSAVATVALSKLESNATLPHKNSSTPFGFRAVRYFPGISSEISQIKQCIRNGFEATPQFGFTSTSARDVSFGATGTTTAHAEIPTLSLLISGVNPSYIGNLSSAPGETEILMYPNTYVRWLQCLTSPSVTSSQRKHLAVGEVVDPAVALSTTVLNERAQRVKPLLVLPTSTLKNYSRGLAELQGFLLDKLALS